ADAGYFVRGDRHSNPCRAHEHAAFGETRGDVLGHSTGIIRVVRRFGRIRAEVDYFVAGAAQRIANLLLQSEPGVIGANSYFHKRRNDSTTLHRGSGWFGYTLVSRR